MKVIFRVPVDVLANATNPLVYHRDRTMNDEMMLVEELESRFEMAAPIDSTCTSTCKPN
jgi:hypothetical protein